MPVENDRERRAHWDAVYADRDPTAVSWFQDTPDSSLQLITHAGIGVDDAIIDIGGGAGLLVDHLLDRGFRDLTVLDISATALGNVRARLGPRAADVRWIAADVLEADLPGPYCLWHDRAAFHFLTKAADRARYREQLVRALLPRGHVVIATFASDGPERCSGLEVVRYRPEELAEELGPAFELLETWDEEHQTPQGRLQRFVFCRFRRVATP